jgi:hypothetical protein
MLHDRRHDREFVESIETIRKELASAKRRVERRHPGARIRWVVESATWTVIDPDTRESLDAARSLADLAASDRAPTPQPMSGTYRNTDDGGDEGG